eukprot:4182791-Prymnesium_polylepis.1
MLQLISGADEPRVPQAEPLDRTHVLGRQVEVSRVIEQLLRAVGEGARTSGGRGQERGPRWGRAHGSGEDTSEGRGEGGGWRPTRRRPRCTPG